MLTVRRAEIKDIPTIMQFMEDYWVHDFALAHDRNFFEWQFVKDGKVNIWIGIDDETRVLYAIQSVIIYRNSQNPDVSGSVWRAIKSGNPILALEVQEKYWNDLRPRASFSPGLRPDAIKVCKLNGNPVITMEHYYRLSDRNDYKIAVVKEKLIPQVKDSGYRLEPIHTIAEMQKVIPESVLINGAPSKDYAYIKWRYFDHPVYKYDLWKIVTPDGQACAVLISREEHVNDRIACKIVDFYGENKILGRITTALDIMLLEKDYEFADIYSYGVPAELYENAGLVKCDTQSGNIIPHYYHPYTAANIDIFLVPLKIPGTRLFRGDSDQDKPRLITELS